MSPGAPVTKHTHTWPFKQKELILSGVRPGGEPQCQQAVHSEGFGENPALPLPALVAPGVPWPWLHGFYLCLHLHRASPLCVPSQISYCLSLIRTPVFLQDDLILRPLTSLHLQRPFSHKGYIHRFWGGQNVDISFGGATIQPIPGSSGTVHRTGRHLLGSCTPEILCSLRPWQRLARSVVQ